MKGRGAERRWPMAVAHREQTNDRREFGAKGGTRTPTPLRAPALKHEEIEA
jgi:hypothetical protein